MIVIKAKIKKRFERLTQDILETQTAIVELAADTRRMASRYSELCGKASDALDAVRSAIPTGFTLLRINLGKIQ
jgi:hypothetical protein